MTVYERADPTAKYLHLLIRHWCIDAKWATLRFELCPPATLSPRALGSSVSILPFGHLHLSSRRSFV